MKTMIEIQYQEKDVKDCDLDKYVKETLKEQGIKATEVETLNIYYLPETAKVFYVAIKKDNTEVKGELDVNNMPEYPVVEKKPAAKKTTKKEVKKEAVKEVVAEKPVVAEVKAEAKPVKAAKPTKKAARKAKK